MTAPEIRRIGVVGLGAMGAGIAQLAIEAGYETVGREVSDELGAAARDRIAHFLQRKVDKERMSASEREAALGLLTTTTELSASPTAISYRGDRRGSRGEARALRARSRGSSGRTRSLRRTRRRSPSPRSPRRSRRPERVVGMHFFNPAPLMPLVEIVRAELRRTTPSRRPSPSASAWASGRSGATTRPASSSTVCSSRC